MRKKVFLTGMFSLLLAFVMLVSACKSDDDDSSSSNNNSGTGIGSITISGIKAGLNGATILHNSVTGTHQTLQAYTLAGGEMSGATFDNSGSTTISGGSVTIPVRGVNNNASYEFTNGGYTVNLRVSGATSAADDGPYTLTVNFSGSNGTGTANNSNGLGMNP
jgi:hypothetical protein